MTLVTLSSFNDSERSVGIPQFFVVSEAVESLTVEDGVLEHRVLAAPHRLTQLL